MSVLDDRGRVFGLVNLVDALVLGFCLLLIPIAYGTWLLFHPRKVQITSVTRVTMTKEEQRIANPLRAAAKLKVKGSGFSPMLRAWVGPEPSFGFTFEDPNSADVIVGPMPPGTYDLALYDGGLEVARAPKAYVIQAKQNHDQLKAVGRLVDLDKATADGLKAGAAFPAGADARVQVAALGPIEPGRRVLLAQPGRDGQREGVDVPRAGSFERAAALVLGCDATEPPETTCTIGGQYPSAGSQLRVAGPADAMTFIVDELLPAVPAEPMELTVRLSGGPELALIKAGDRDSLLDDRAAVVTSIGARTGSTLDVRMRIGADQARDGWRYRGHSIKTGVPFSLTTDRYIASGTVVSATPVSKKREPMTNGVDFERLEMHVQASWLIRGLDAIANASLAAADRSTVAAWLRQIRSRWDAVSAAERVRAVALFSAAATLGHPLLLPIVPSYIAPALPAAFWLLVGATALIVALAADGLIVAWESSIVRRLWRG